MTTIPHHAAAAALFLALSVALPCLAAEESGVPQAPASSPSIADGAATVGPPLSATREAGKLPPLAEMITSPFGRRRMPGWLSRRGMVMREHSGLDIRARLGWPVVAFDGGMVSHAGPHGLSRRARRPGSGQRGGDVVQALVGKGLRVTENAGQLHLVQQGMQHFFHPGLHGLGEFSIPPSSALAIFPPGTETA